MYNKLFTKILDSSIWLEDHPTRIVWLTFIAVMDEDGFCTFASAANVARRAIVSLEEAKIAIDKLQSPDEDSSDKEHDGRRIERVPGGWIVLNSGKYKELVSRAIIQEQTRERVRRHREKLKLGNAGVTPPTVTPTILEPGNAPVTPSDTDTDVRTKERTQAEEPPGGFQSVENSTGGRPEVAREAVTVQPLNRRQRGDNDRLVLKTVYEVLKSANGDGEADIVAKLKDLCAERRLNVGDHAEVIFRQLDIARLKLQREAKPPTRKLKLPSAASADKWKNL